MKLDQLSYFLETARTEHIGKASKILAISPSAISHSISSLEAELGQKLFCKNGKYISLTTHGMLLKQRASELLAQASAIKEELTSNEIELQGNVRLAATHQLCSKLLTPAWCKFQQKHPLLTSEIYTTRSVDVIDGVMNGYYDFGICFSPLEHPDLECEVLHKGQLKIVVKKSHPLLKKRAKEQLACISQYGAILPKAFSGIEVCEQNPMFKKFNIDINRDCLFDSYEIAEIKLSCSKSWSLFPDFICDSKNSRVSAISHPKTWSAPYTVSAIWRKDRILQRSLEGLKSQIYMNLQ